MPRAEGTSLLALKLDATVPTDPSDAVKQLSTLGIDRLDIIIANAGVSHNYPKVSDVKTEDMQRYSVPITYGVIWLYQATLILIKKSKSPIWVSMGSTAGYLRVCVFQET